MHNAEEPQGYRDVVQQAIEIANAQTNGSGPIVYPFTVSFCDIDLPVIVANGEVYVQATLQGFFDALSEALVKFLRDLEIGIPEARRASLAYANSHPELGIQGVAIDYVVRDSGEQR